MKIPILHRSDLQKRILFKRLVFHVEIATELDVAQKIGIEIGLPILIADVEELIFAIVAHGVKVLQPRLRRIEEDRIFIFAPLLFPSLSSL